MEGLDSTDFPKNWLSLKSINYSTTDMGGGDEEDDRNVIESNTRPFRGNYLDDQGGISRSTEANQNMTCRSFGSEEEAKCPVCSRSFGSMKAMHGHMRCHPERGWRGATCPVPPPPSSAKKSASSSSDSLSHASTTTSTLVLSDISPSPSHIPRIRKGKRGQKGNIIINSSKKLKMDEKGASSGSRDDQEDSGNTSNIASWKEDLKLGLNYGSEEVERNKKKKKKSRCNSTDKKASSSSSSDDEEEGHKCKTCKKSFPTGQALGGHQTIHRRKSAQLVFPEEASWHNATPRVPVGFDLNELPPQFQGRGF